MFDCMSLCMYVCIYLSKDVCTYVCIYVCMYVCMFVCVYMLISQNDFRHVYNPGGGAKLAGGNYPMMLADIKSCVMQMSEGRQMPWSCIVPQDADRVSVCVRH